MKRRTNLYPLKVVSLYDGIACGRIALDRAGFAVSHYAAFEIDKYPRSISRYQYPGIAHYGDVLTADFTEFAGYDLVIGGSPCTFWSIAKANREMDKDGMGWKLFMRFVDAVRQIKPRYFLYENVASMPKTIKAYISEELGCEPILINSALVSAQQRKRLYWTDIPNITQPEDKGILLRDILESEDVTLKDKSQTLCAQYYKENARSMLTRGKIGLFVAHEVGAALRTRGKGEGRGKRLEVRGDGKCNALTTVQTDSVVCMRIADKHSEGEQLSFLPPHHPVRIGEIGAGGQGNAVYSDEGKFAALTTNKANFVVQSSSPIRVGVIGAGGQGSRIYSVYGKTVTLTAEGGGRGGKTGLYKVDLPDGDYTIRKLTPIEAERCQTLPDNYTALGVDDSAKEVKISNTQRYKAVGNGWTVDVIAHILRHMKEEMYAVCACAA